MSKIAFMFPGQGSFEAGMGKDVAEAVPEAMAVYDEGSEASGMDLKQLCFDRPARGARRHGGAAAGARRDVASRSTRRCASRGIAPDFVVGHSVGEFAALGSARVDLGRATRSRSSASAGSRWPRPRRSTPARWRRSSASPTRPSRRSATRSRTCGRRTTTARASSSSPARRRRSTRPASRRSAKARAARSSCASPARSTRRSSRARATVLRPAIEKVHLPEGTAAFMSTVTAKIEDAQRYRELLIEQLTAPVRFTQSARELINHGVTTFVEVGPGNVLERFTEEDRPQRSCVLRQRPRVARRGDRGTWLTTFRVPRGQARARHRRLERHRPRDRRGARARRRGGRRRLPLGQGRGRGARRGRSAAARCRPTSRRPRTRSASSTRRATSTCSSTTPG